MRNISIKKLAAQIRIIKEQKRGCILFLGAGASKSAGIPTAMELSQILKFNSLYKDLLEDDKDFNYSSLMAELTPNNRKEFIKGFIDNSKLNKTHLYAAALMKAGFIDTVVTVNFDPLMLKALSLVNIFPAVYDMAISREFVIGGIEHPAVVYLHGQSHGFWQLNTEEELPIALNNIRSLFSEITSTRALIVVGYSGNDPVFDELSKIAKFEHGIFWVGYKNELPSEKVQLNLLNRYNKSPWFLSGYESDEFFDELRTCLGVGIPDVINKPFTFLLESLSIISEFQTLNEINSWHETTISWVKTAIDVFEINKSYFDDEDQNLIGLMDKDNDKQMHAIYYFTHVLRAPIVNLIGIAELLEHEIITGKIKVGDDILEMLNYLKKSGLEVDNNIRKLTAQISKK